MSPSFEALELLTERAHWVRGLAKTLVQDEAAAEDVAQDAAVEAIRSAGSARRIGPGWLAGVVRNVASGANRRARARNRHERASSATAATALSAAEAAAFVEQQRLLADAVLGLDQPFRDVVLLRFYEGKPQRVIARELGVPVATVNSRLTRAVAKLRERLDRDHDGDRDAWVRALGPIVIAAPQAGAIGSIGGGLLMMNKKLVGALCIAVLFAIGAGLYTNFGSSLDAEENPSTVVAGVADLNSDPVESESLDEVAERAAIELDGAAPARPIEGPFVRIIDAKTGAAVPAAEVRRVDATVFAQIGEVVSPIVRAFTHGQPMPIDAEARVSAHGLGQNAALYARTADRVGHLYLYRATPDADGCYELELWPLQTCVVTVEDARGQLVAGVPVGLTACSTSLPNVPYAIVFSDDNGRAELEWFSAMLDGMAGARFEVGLAYPSDVDGVRLVERPDGVQKVRLQCANVGTVRVRVDQYGEPVEDGTQVFLQAARNPEYALPAGMAGRTEGGVATFWPVEVGIRLRAGAWLSPATQMFKAKSGGLSRDDETVEISIELESRMVEFVGRAVNLAGDPLRDAELHGHVRFRGVSTHGRQLTTDTDGRFRFQAVLDDRRRDLVFDLRPQRATRVTSVPFRLERGRSQPHDLGEVVMEELAPFVRGRVVDRDGRPVPHIAVEIVAPSALGSEDRSVVAITQLPTDDKGRFELFGVPPKGMGLRIRARCRAGLRHEPVAWKVGEDEVELVAEPASSLVGELRAPVGVPLEQLRVAAWDESRGPADYEVGVDWRSGNARTDASFEVSELSDASYTVVVRLSSGQVLARIEGVRVKGARSRDARLAPLRVGDSLRRLDLRVRDVLGRKLDAMAIAVGASGERWTLGATHDPVLLTEAATAVYVGAKGYFPAEVGALSGEHTVTLEHGVGVSLRIAGTEVVPAKQSLRVRLAPIGEAEAERVWAGVSPPDTEFVRLRTGRVNLRVRRPGRFEVRLFLMDRRVSAEVDVAIEPRVVVDVVSGGGLIDIAVPPAAITTAAGKLR